MRVAGAVPWPSPSATPRRSDELREDTGIDQSRPGAAAGGADGAARRPRQGTAAGAAPARRRHRPCAAPPSARLAAYDDPKTPDAILAVFGSLTAEEKRDALNTLAARAAYGKALHGRRRREEGAGRTTCRPTSSASCATSRTRTSTSASPRSGASSARRRPTAPSSSPTGRRSSNAHRTAAGPGAGPGHVRQDVPAVPHALRRRRQGRAGHHRLQPAEPRLPAGKHPRPQRRHPQRVQGDDHRPARVAASSPASSAARRRPR